MAVPINPYIAGNPVGNTPAFVGRDDVLREVLQVLQNPNQNAITLFGQRRIGKTSVLQNLVTHLPKSGAYIPVYFDLQDKAAWPLSRVLLELAQTIAAQLDLPAPELGNDPEGTFKTKWIPDTLNALPEKASLVLLFDEFDVLAGEKSQAAGSIFFPYLRELMALDRIHLQFIFVLGRNITDLSSIALSLFKGAPDKRISLLSVDATQKLARLSETAGTLKWQSDALEAIWELTHGHPFLTQALCSKVWEAAYEASDAPEPVTSADVYAVVSETIEASRNTLEWLWDGLGPAERVVISALAQNGGDAVDETRLEQILRESGVRILIRELQNAPQTLQDWDLIEPIGDGYVFRVEMLRRWIAEARPLKRVQDELDRVQPLAENLFQSAQGFYSSGNMEQAEDLAQRAINLNPNHLKANELLAEILISRNDFEAAQGVLEKLIENYPAAARPRLVQVYLNQAEGATSEAEQLKLYEKVLAIDPDHPAVGAHYYPLVRSQTHRIVANYENNQEYEKALEAAQQALELFPNDQTWQEKVKSLEARTKLDVKYKRALGALQKGERSEAIKLLIDVISIQSDYEQAVGYLYQAVTGKSAKPTVDGNRGMQINWPVRIGVTFTSIVLIFGLLGGGFLLGRNFPAVQSIITATPTHTPTETPVFVTPIFTASPTSTTEEPTSTSTPDVPQPETLFPPSPMQEIPSGSFMMGSESGAGDEQPVREVTVDAFWMDQSEATNAMYARCVEAGACSPPSSTGNYANDAYADHPVVYVDWNKAQTYCEWAGGRLPTEAEWEYAARGGLEGATYPWGDETPVCEVGVENGASFTNCSDRGTRPVGSYAPNGYGLYDMAGNVWEWVSSEYKAYPYDAGDGREDLTTNVSRGLRGGSWLNYEYNLRVAYRNGDTPSLTDDLIGFRCSRSE